VVCVRARRACVRAVRQRARARARVYARLAPSLSPSLSPSPSFFLRQSARRALFRSPSLRAVLPIPLLLPSFLTGECAARLHARVRGPSRVRAWPRDVRRRAALCAKKRGSEGESEYVRSRVRACAHACMHARAHVRTYARTRARERLLYARAYVCTRASVRIRARSGSSSSSSCGACVRVPGRRGYSYRNVNLVEPLFIECRKIHRNLATRGEGLTRPPLLAIALAGLTPREGRQPLPPVSRGPPRGHPSALHQTLSLPPPPPPPPPPPRVLLLLLRHFLLLVLLIRVLIRVLIFVLLPSAARPVALVLADSSAPPFPR